MNLILQVGTFAKIIITILFFFSLFSWAIILHKLRLLRKVRRENQHFLSYYRRQKSIKETKDTCDMFKNSPLAKVAMAGIREWESFDLKNPTSERRGWILESLLAAVRERMENRMREEEREYERNISFLATVTAASPFLGLLGTVWGITQAFLNIRGLPVINLTVIAPGISDALITTIAGLLVAVPTLIAYNYILSLVRSLVFDLEMFSQELTNDLRRQFLTSI